MPVLGEMAGWANNGRPCRLQWKRTSCAISAHHSANETPVGRGPGGAWELLGARCVSARAPPGTEINSKHPNDRRPAPLEGLSQAMGDSALGPTAGVVDGRR